MSVTLKDFQPINNWTPDLTGPKWNCCKAHKGQAKFLVDESTGRHYLNESSNLVRFKCFLLTVGTPFVHALASIANVAYRVLSLASLSHFWGHRGCHSKSSKPSSYMFTARLADAGKDLLRIIATPLTLLGLELAAIYGLFRPYDGRKLYATIERAAYGHFILAPCFQPNPTCHALGGNINKKNAF